MKEKILNILKLSEDYISGEELSKKFGITRAAIWKHMKSLKEEGYEIMFISKKGYKLISTPDILTYEEIKDKLTTKYIGKNIIHYNTIDSTNKIAKKLAINNIDEGTVIISEEQTEGRGRLGRIWSSPKGKGIWFSVILKPNINPIMASRVTLIGAASVYCALSEMNIKTKIKWPNDIVLNNKKLCGILTEMSGEVDKLNYIVMGIGINVNVEKFNDDLKDIATSLKIEEEKSIDRKELLSKIINNLEAFYNKFKENGDIEEVVEICKNNSAIIGKKIKIINCGKERIVKAVNLDKDGELLIENEDGLLEKIISGEISIRSLYGYA